MFDTILGLSTIYILELAVRECRTSALSSGLGFKLGLATPSSSEPPIVSVHPAGRTGYGYKSLFGQVGVPVPPLET